MSATESEKQRRAKEAFDRIFKRPCFGSGSCPEWYWQEQMGGGFPKKYIIKCPYSTECFYECGKVVREKINRSSSSL